MLAMINRRTLVPTHHNEMGLGKLASMDRAALEGPTAARVWSMNRVLAMALAWLAISPKKEW